VVGSPLNWWDILCTNWKCNLTGIPIHMWSSLASNFIYHKMLNSELENTFALSGHSARCCRTLLTNSLQVQMQMKDTIHTTWFSGHSGHPFQAIWSFGHGLFLFLYLFISVEMFTLHTSNEGEISCHSSFLYIKTGFQSVYFIWIFILFYFSKAATWPSEKIIVIV
jgi:hypothetical protein